MDSDANNAPLTCKCGAGPHAEDEGFCANHHPFKGHGGKLSFKHGLYADSNNAWAQLTVAGRERAEQFAAAVRKEIDAEDDLVRAAYLERLVELECLVADLAARLHKAGPMSRGGKPTRVLNSYLLVLDKWDKVAQRVATHRGVLDGEVYLKTALRRVAAAPTGT